LFLVVQDASLSVLQDNFSIHYLLVGLRDNCNQEVKKNNENENLIQNPEEVNGVDHEDSSAALEICCSLSNVGEDFISLDIMIT
jgi:hypothetical protein